MRKTRFKYEVVNSFPEKLRARTVYITADRDLAGHLCACGCEKEVITPLSPTDWSIKLNRRGVTLNPSIGNWAYPCRSHYFILDGNVVWEDNMSNETITRGRQKNRSRKLSYYGDMNGSQYTSQGQAFELRADAQTLLAWWKRLFVK
jgi:hypothetical protein